MENNITIDSVDPRITFSFRRPLRMVEKPFSDSPNVSIESRDGVNVITSFKDLATDPAELNIIISDHFPKSTFFGPDSEFRKHLSVCLKRDGRKYRCRLSYADEKVSLKISRSDYSDVRVLNRAIKKLKREIKEKRSLFGEFQNESENYFV